MHREQEILNRFEFISHLFNPASLERSATLQFRVTDPQLPSGHVDFSLQAQGDGCSIQEGVRRRWDVSIKVDYRLWLDLQSRKVSRERVMELLEEGRALDVQGDRDLFHRLGSIFSGTLDDRYLPPAVPTVDPTPAGSGWKRPRQVVLLSGSGRSKRFSTSYYLARHLAEGMAGAHPAPHIRVIHLRDLDFSECSGCFRCWRNGGTCVLDDDYTSVIAPALETSDLLVLSFPLYFYNFPPQINHVITRMFANLQPTYHWDRQARGIVHDHRSRMPGSIFLMGTGGLLDTGQFQVPVMQASMLARRHAMRYAGHLFRSTGNTLLIPAARTTLTDEIDASLLQAGLELVQSGVVSDETARAVQQPILSPAQLRSLGHALESVWNGEFRYPVPQLRNPVSRFDVGTRRDRAAEETVGVAGLPAEA